MDIFQTALDASSSREHNILFELGHVQAELLDGNHHPCPKCGGNDRFRWIEDNGSCFCNQCFKTTKADVVSSLAWLLDIGRKDAAQRILDHLGVKYKRKKDFRDHIVIQEWKPNYDLIAAPWAMAKQVTVDAMKMAGVVLADYRKQHRVFAFPIHGESNKILGYSMYNCGPASMLPKFKGKGQPPEWIKCKACEGSTKGILGAVQHIEDAETVMICEGGTDMLAAITEGYVAVSPSNGAGQKLPTWLIDKLEGKHVIVIADRDVPGQKALEAWSQQVSAKAASVRSVELPYDLAETKGKDLRDFLEDHPGKLKTFIENTEAFEPEKTESGEVADAELVEEEEQIYRNLGIVVKQIVQPNGAELYCKHTRKTKVIPNVDYMSLPALASFCGSRAYDWIREPHEESAYKINIHDARRFVCLDIANLDSHSRICGMGIWKTKKGNFVLINGGSAYQIFEDRIEKLEDVRLDEIFILYGEDDWFDGEDFEKHFESAADPEWRKEVVAELYTFIDRWTWDHQNHQYLLAGMILATMIQSTLPWRPLMSIIGDSSSGKSIFANFLACLMGKNTVFTDDTSKAGLIRDIRGGCPFVLHDEWDNANRKHREGILQMVRTSSRQTGGTGPQKRTLRSNSHQQAVSSEFHPVILWISGINNDIQAAPDLNRTIEVHLGEYVAGGPKDVFFRESRTASICEEGIYAGEIGCKLLAVAARTLPSILRLYKTASLMRMEGVPSRTMENWSVPAATLCAAWGFGEDGLENVLERIRDIYLRDEGLEQKSTARELMEDILDQEVRLDGGQTKVLSSLIQDSQWIDQYRDVIEAHGISFVERSGEQFVFVNGAAVAKRKITDKSSRSISQILGRIEGAVKGYRCQMSGARKRGTLIPVKFVREIVPNICWSPANKSWD